MGKNEYGTTNANIISNRDKNNTERNPQDISTCTTPPPSPNTISMNDEKTDTRQYDIKNIIKPNGAHTNDFKPLPHHTTSKENFLTKKIVSKYQITAIHTQTDACL